MKRALSVVPLAVVITLSFQVHAADSTYFDATNSIIDPANPVGTRWHELWPNYCREPYTINGWADNGDGVLSFCDVIAMENPDGLTECHHVLEVTLTLELERLTPPDVVPHYWDWDGESGDPMTNPVCTWWFEVYPDHGSEFHIVAWEDNESGTLDSCDAVVDDKGNQYHVKGVHTDMVTEPEDDCATDLSTWSRVKTLYR